MTKISTILAASALLMLAGAPAFAQTVSKTWVSSTTGNDTGTCQFVSPCKTFAYAVTQTAPGGELDVKDSGSYGPLTISHAISVVSAGALAAISIPSGGTGITINAGAHDKVILQGLVIDGHSVGDNGIVFSSGASLTIEDCHVRNVTDNGIELVPLGGQLFNISNTEVANAGQNGIDVAPVNTTVTGAFFHLYLHDSSIGLFINTANVTLIDSKISTNGIGMKVISPGKVLLGQTTINANIDSGLVYGGGGISSYGDNNINGNGTGPDNGEGASFALVAKQ